MKFSLGTATKRISGLPAFPSGKLVMDKSPAKKGKSVCRIKDRNLVLTYDNGYPVEIANTKGKLPAVWIVETAYPGFTVRLYDKPYTILGYGYRKANQLAMRLALRGHKRVINR